MNWCDLYLLSSFAMKPETRKHEIIKTAARLFKEKGYSAVTMRDIAKAMGIKAASLYNHINSKQEILNAIIISVAEQFTEGMKAICNSNDSSVKKLKDIIVLHVNIANRNTDGIAALNNDWMHLEEQLEYYLRLRHDYEDDFRKIIQQGIDDGEIVNLNSDVMLFSILSTLRSLYLWIPKKEHLDIDELTANLSQVLISGINK